MASTSLQETIEFWNQLIEYADVMQKQTTGAEDVTWTAPNGETGKSFLGYVREFFEVFGHLPRFKTVEALKKNDADFAAGIGGAIELKDGSFAFVADDTYDKNGVYIKNGGTWVKSDYDKLNAPRYMPTATTDINTLTEAGIYMPHSDIASRNFGLPGRSRGVLLVTGRYYPDQLMQIYFTAQGTFMRHNTGGDNWEEWTSSFSGNWFYIENDANNFIDTGLYPSAFNGPAPSTTNLPTQDDRFVLLVSKSSSTRQVYISNSGLYFRSSIALGASWSDWVQLSDPSILGKIRKEALVGSQTDLRELYERGNYTGSISSRVFDNSIVDTPFEEPETKFNLVVNNTGLTSRQYFHSPIGLATRSIYLIENEDGVMVPDESINNGKWTNWSGIKYPSGSILDLGELKDKVNNLSIANAKGNVIYGWGSSTLYLAGNYLSQLAEAEGYIYVDHGVSGETLAVSGMQQGSNIVTVNFADATLTNNTNHAVTITQSFKPKRGRAYKEVELSNGVKGLLYFSEKNGELANTFKPTNLTEPLEVDTTYEYRAINPDFINQGKGLYYFDIGKNNMGYTDTAQDIVDAQQEMIDYIPDGSEYLVGGHFVNTNLGGTDYGNKVEAVNQMLKLRYGLRFCDFYDFLYDDAVWAKYGITKTAEDIAAIAAGELPPSMGRDIGTETRDTSHLRDEMSEELAIQAINRFKELGYIK